MTPHHPLAMAPMVPVDDLHAAVEQEQLEVVPVISVVALTVVSAEPIAQQQWVCVVTDGAAVVILVFVCLPGLWELVLQSPPPQQLLHSQLHPPKQPSHSEY